MNDELLMQFTLRIQFSEYIPKQILDKYNYVFIKKEEIIFFFQKSFYFNKKGKKQHCFLPFLNIFSLLRIFYFHS